MSPLFQNKCKCSLTLPSSNQSFDKKLQTVTSLYYYDNSSLLASLGLEMPEKDEKDSSVVSVGARDKDRNPTLNVASTIQ